MGAGMWESVIDRKNKPQGEGVVVTPQGGVSKTSTSPRGGGKPSEVLNRQKSLPASLSPRNTTNNLSPRSILMKNGNRDLSQGSPQRAVTLNSEKISLTHLVNDPVDEQPKLKPQEKVTQKYPDDPGSKGLKANKWNHGTGAPGSSLLRNGLEEAQDNGWKIQVPEGHRGSDNASAIDVESLISLAETAEMESKIKSGKWADTHRNEAKKKRVSALTRLFGGRRKSVDSDKESSKSKSRDRDEALKAATAAVKNAQKSSKSKKNSVSKSKKGTSVSSSESIMKNNHNDGGTGIGDSLKFNFYPDMSMKEGSHHASAAPSNVDDMSVLDSARDSNVEQSISNSLNAVLYSGRSISVSQSQSNSGVSYSTNSTSLGSTLSQVAAELNQNQSTATNQEVSNIVQNIVMAQNVGSAAPGANDDALSLTEESALEEDAAKENIESNDVVVPAAGAAGQDSEVLDLENEIADLNPIDSDPLPQSQAQAFPPSNLTSDFKSALSSGFNIMSSGPGTSLGSVLNLTVDAGLASTNLHSTSSMNNNNLNDDSLILERKINSIEDKLDSMVIDQTEDGLDSFKIDDCQAGLDAIGSFSGAADRSGYDSTVINSGSGETQLRSGSVSIGGLEKPGPSSSSQSGPQSQSKGSDGKQSSGSKQSTKSSFSRKPTQKKQVYLDIDSPHSGQGQGESNLLPDRMRNPRTKALAYRKNINSSRQYDAVNRRVNSAMHEFKRLSYLIRQRKLARREAVLRRHAEFVEHSSSSSESSIGESTSSESDREEDRRAEEAENRGSRIQRARPAALKSKPFKGRKDPYDRFANRPLPETAVSARIAGLTGRGWYTGNRKDKHESFLHDRFAKKSELDLLGSRARIKQRHKDFRHGEVNRIRGEKMKMISGSGPNPLSLTHQHNMRQNARHSPHGHKKHSMYVRRPGELKPLRRLPLKNGMMLKVDQHVWHRNWGLNYNRHEFGKRLELSRVPFPHNWRGASYKFWLRRKLERMLGDNVSNGLQHLSANSLNKMKREYALRINEMGENVPIEMRDIVGGISSSSSSSHAPLNWSEGAGGEIITKLQEKFLQAIEQAGVKKALDDFDNKYVEALGLSDSSSSHNGQVLAANANGVLTNTTSSDPYNFLNLTNSVRSANTNYSQAMAQQTLMESLARSASNNPYIQALNTHRSDISNVNSVISNGLISNIFEGEHNKSVASKSSMNSVNIDMSTSDIVDVASNQGVGEEFGANSNIIMASGGIHSVPGSGTRMGPGSMMFGGRLGSGSPDDVDLDDANIGTNIGNMIMNSESGLRMTSLNMGSLGGPSLGSVARSSGSGGMNLNNNTNNVSMGQILSSQTERASLSSQRVTLTDVTGNNVNSGVNFNDLESGMPRVSTHSSENNAINRGSQGSLDIAVRNSNQRSSQGIRNSNQGPSSQVIPIRNSNQGPSQGSHSNSSSQKLSQNQKPSEISELHDQAFQDQLLPRTISENDAHLSLQPDSGISSNISVAGNLGVYQSYYQNATGSSVNSIPQLRNTAMSASAKLQDLIKSGIPPGKLSSIMSLNSYASSSNFDGQRDVPFDVAQAAIDEAVSGSFNPADRVQKFNQTMGKFTLNNPANVGFDVNLAVHGLVKGPDGLIIPADADEMLCDIEGKDLEELPRSKSGRVIHPSPWYWEHVLDQCKLGMEPHPSSIKMYQLLLEDQGIKMLQRGTNNKSGSSSSSRNFFEIDPRNLQAGLKAAGLPEELLPYAVKQWITPKDTEKSRALAERQWEKYFIEQLDRSSKIADVFSPSANAPFEEIHDGRRELRRGWMGNRRKFLQRNSLNSKKFNKAQKMNILSKQRGKFGLNNRNLESNKLNLLTDNITGKQENLKPFTRSLYKNLLKNDHFCAHFTNPATSSPLFRGSDDLMRYLTGHDGIYGHGSGGYTGGFGVSTRNAEEMSVGSLARAFGACYGVNKSVTFQPAINDNARAQRLHRGFNASPAQMMEKAKEDRDHAIYGTDRGSRYHGVHGVDKDTNTVNFFSNLNNLNTDDNNGTVPRSRPSTHAKLLMQHTSDTTRVHNIVKQLKFHHLKSRQQARLSQGNNTFLEDSNEGDLNLKDNNDIPRGFALRTEAGTGTGPVENTMPEVTVTAADDSSEIQKSESMWQKNLDSYTDSVYRDETEAATAVSDASNRVKETSTVTAAAGVTVKDAKDAKDQAPSRARSAANFKKAEEDHLSRIAAREERPIQTVANPGAIIAQNSVKKDSSDTVTVVGANTNLTSLDQIPEGSQEENTVTPMRESVTEDNSLSAPLNCQEEVPLVPPQQLVPTSVTASSDSLSDNISNLASVLSSLPSEGPRLSNTHYTQDKRNTNTVAPRNTPMVARRESNRLLEEEVQESKNANRSEREAGGLRPGGMKLSLLETELQDVGGDVGEVADPVDDLVNEETVNNFNLDSTVSNSLNGDGDRDLNGPNGPGNSNLNLNSSMNISDPIPPKTIESVQEELNQVNLDSSSIDSVQNALNQMGLSDSSDNVNSSRGNLRQNSVSRSKMLTETIRPSVTLATNFSSTNRLNQSLNNDNSNVQQTIKPTGPKYDGSSHPDAQIIQDLVASNTQLSDSLKSMTDFNTIQRISGIAPTNGMKNKTSTKFSSTTNTNSLSLLERASRAASRNFISNANGAPDSPNRNSTFLPLGKASRSEPRISLTLRVPPAKSLTSRGSVCQGARNSNVSIAKVTVRNSRSSIKSESVESVTGTSTSQPLRAGSNNLASQSYSGKALKSSMKNLKSKSKKVVTSDTTGTGTAVELDRASTLKSQIESLQAQLKGLESTTNSNQITSGVSVTVDNEIESDVMDSMETPKLGPQDDVSMTIPPTLLTGGGSGNNTTKSTGSNLKSMMKSKNSKKFKGSTEASNANGSNASWSNVMMGQNAVDSLVNKTIATKKRLYW